MRTPVALFVLALGVRAIVAWLYPDPAYPDSYYYVEVARSIAAGHGLNVDFIWIFAEVGNRIPEPAVLPVPSNAHWLPLASFLQAPFVALLGPTALAAALPAILVGSLAAPLTWLIARDAGARPLTATAAGVLIAVPGTMTVFMAQPETFGLVMPLVAATLWLAGRALRGDGRSFILAGFLAGLVALTRNDGILLGGTLGLVWLADRVRWWRTRRGRRAWTHMDDRGPIPWLAGGAALLLFLVPIVPWWLRQLSVFGSISPTSSSGAALWIRDISEWNSITADPSLASFLAQGGGAILASRLDGLADALTIFAVLVCSVVLVPFLLLGILARRHSPEFQPWFAYTFVIFAGATLLYPLHVPGGTFIHSAVGLAPHAVILAVEGVILLVTWIAGRRRSWEAGTAASVITWGVVLLVIATGVVFGRPTQERWDETRQPRLALAAELSRLGARPDERLLSIDAGGLKYFTGRGGVVTPDDPLETIETVARAYEIRWLVLERNDIVEALVPVLSGTRPAWIGPPAFTVPTASSDTGASEPDGFPALALYPVCTAASDPRCQ